MAKSLRKKLPRKPAVTKTKTKKSRSTSGKKAAKKPSTTSFAKKHGVKLRVAAEILTLAVAAEKLIELTVQFWRSLPMGPGTGMPAEYEELSQDVEFSGSLNFPFYEPTNKGPESIDWQLAKKIRLDAESIRKKLQSGASPESLSADIDSLEADKRRLIDTTQSGLQDMFRYQIDKRSAELGFKLAG